MCRRKAVARLQTIFLCFRLFVQRESQITHLQTTVVGDVLAERERTVGMYAGCHLDLIESLFHHFRAGIESRFVFGRPPVNHVAVLVELATLVIEAVRHLMSDHDTNRTVVERIVGTHVEERILQNTGGETDLVARGVIVRVHRLRRHVPFLLIYRLAEVTQTVVLFELSRPLQVGIIRIFGIDIELAVVPPFVRIADLDGHGVQFLQGFVFGLTTHPCQVLDTDT